MVIAKPFTFETEYGPKSRVIIKALERPATVGMVRIDSGGGVDYYVEWWDEGERRREWLDGDELKANPHVTG